MEMRRQRATTMISTKKSVIRGGLLGFFLAIFYLSWGSFGGKIAHLCVSGFIYKNCFTYDSAELGTIIIVHTLLVVMSATIISAVTFLIINRAIIKAQKAGAQLL